MSLKIAITYCVAGVLTGVGATLLLTRPGDAAQAASRPDRSARDARGEHALPIVIDSKTGVKAEEIRTLVAEEVRAALREQAPARMAGDAPAPATEAKALEPTPAFEQMKGHVTERIRQGAWTAADRDWMRSMLGSVNSSERSDLMRQVIVAANSGALRVELAGPLF
jgi:hypothetical protein